MQSKFRWGHGVACAVAGLISACGGGGGGSTTSSASLAGLAATGAGLPNATVTAKCASGAALTGTTDTNGNYTLVMDGRTLPCMVQVTSSSPAVTLHSFAQSAGRVNITPVTDLIVAKALGADPASAFGSYASTHGTSIEAGLAAAKTYVNTQINAITGGAIADPLAGAFAVGDADDKVLDALGNAMRAASADIGTLRTQLLSNNALTALVPAYLAQPTGLTANAASSTSILLGWTAVPGATGYKIYRGTASGFATTGTAHAETSTASYSDTGLTASATYYYKVVPTNSVVSAGTPSAEVSATTTAASTPTGVACDTSKFQSGAAVSTPTTQQLASFARTYTGSEGDYDTAFTASGSATLVFSADGSATYNGASYVASSYCLETLSGTPSSQLVIHGPSSSHFDLKSDGTWSGVATSGKVVTKDPYSAASSFGTLAISGNAVGLASAVVPASFAPTAQGSHPTAVISWSQAGSTTPWYITLQGDVVTSTAGFGSWQKQAALAGIETLGVVFDMPNGHITFNNVTLPAFSVGQTGSMVLNGTLHVPAATGTALTISGTGTPAAGSGLNAPAATVVTTVSGSTTKNTYTWNGGKGISVVLESYSTGLKTVTLTNAAGPSWRTLSPGSTVTVDSSAKTVQFSTAALEGISPTTTVISLTGTLTLP